MADGGQGLSKFCTTILPENYSSELDNGGDDDFKYSEYNIPLKRRRVYSEGGSTGAISKLTSVHRLIIICIVPQIKETYDNVKLLFDLIKINNISFKFIWDFKLLLIVNGQQTATSIFLYPYCFVSLRNLRDPLFDEDDNVTVI